MARQLRFFWYGCILILGTFVVVLGSIPIPHGFWEDITLAYSCIAVIVGFLLIVFSIDKAGQMLRFWYYCNVKSKHFPQTKEEARALRGWAYDKLRRWALGASSQSSHRDNARKLLNEFKYSAISPIDDPNALEKVRDTKNQELKTLRELQAEYEKKLYFADWDFKRFHKIWDLFKELDMIPIDPNTAVPFADPEIFRKSVSEDKAEDKGAEVSA